MKETRIMMGMPITIEIASSSASSRDLEKIFAYFDTVDQTFSTYKPESEIMRINRHELRTENYSVEMKEIFELSEKTKTETHGYFDIVNRDGIFDPSGIVKGWAIRNASELLHTSGFPNHFVDAGGDIQVAGMNSDKKPWSVGIKNPFDEAHIVKVLYLPHNEGVATSGTYIRGQHIYNPKSKSELITDIVSLTVIGTNVYEADRFATAAFAMGSEGIKFIESIPGLEGYQIDATGTATMTTGFERYTIESPK